MLDRVRIGGVDLHEYVGAMADRAIARAEGLVGLSAPRNVSRAKSEAHGSNNRTRWLAEKAPVLEGEVWGDTMLAAYDDFDVITAAFYRTLSDGAQLLEYRKPDDRNGLTNRVANPSFEVSTANWFVNTGALARIATDFAFGAACAQATGVLGAGPAGGQVIYNGDIAGNNFAVVPGERVFARGSYKVVAAPGTLAQTTVFLSVRWHNGAGAFVAQSDLGYVSPSALGVWAELLGSAIAPAGAAFASVQMTLHNALGGAVTWNVDGLMGVVTPTLSPSYFDGDTEYAYWLGTEHASSGFFDATMQAYAKLAGPILPPIEEGAALLKYQAQLELPDPRSYHTRLKTYIGAALSVGGGGLVFPMTFPITFTESAGGIALVSNRGNIESPPVIRIYGPVTSPRVILVTTGEQVKITGEVASGDFLELDHARRTVKLNGQTLRMNLLDTTASKFFDVPPGAHSIRLVASNFSGAAHHEVLLRDAYGG